MFWNSLSSDSPAAYVMSAFCGTKQTFRVMANVIVSFFVCKPCANLKTKSLFPSNLTSGCEEYIILLIELA